jgi:glutamate 5-kinase
MKCVVVKIGTNALTNADGSINEKLLADLVKQAAKIRTKNNILIVTSGAVGSGKSMLKITRHDEVTRRQIFAVVGQVKLMSIYSKLFTKYKLHVAQMLVTKDDFVHRTHYLNTKNCIESLFKEKVVPIMNENDLVAIEELMFSDNDELAGLISKMICADKLIILTNVAGVYDKKGNVIKEFDAGDEMPANLTAGEKSSFGKGGMYNKFKTASDVAGNGTEVYIASSKEKDVILRIFNGEDLGTKFVSKRFPPARE